LIPCVTFNENTQYFQPYIQGESSCIGDKDTSFLIENHLILPKLSPLNTPTSTDSSPVLSPIHSPFVSSLKIIAEQTQSATHQLQVHSQRKRVVIQ